MSEAAAVTTSAMRSPRALAGAIAILLAIPLTALTAALVGSGDGIVVHAALGLGMLLIGSAVFDFRIHPIVNWIGLVGMLLMAAIFLAQGVGEILQSPAVFAIVYGDPTIQALERLLAYPVILWLAALFLSDSHGKTRVLGGIVLAVVIAAELYGLWVKLGGGTPDIMLRLAYLPPFLWLALEAAKRR